MYMVTRTVVAQTIEILEDWIDTMSDKVLLMSNADRPAMDKRLGEAQSLLNFWRLYLNFLPEEDDAC